MFNKTPKGTKTVLVVEDDPSFQEIITDKLSKTGINSVTAKTAAEAKEALDNNEIDLIWLDHYLKGEQTGYDFVANVKKDSKYKHIPIFVITNYDDYSNSIVFMEKLAQSENPQTYLEFGIDKYFVKSNSSLDEIFKEVKRYLKL